MSKYLIDRIEATPNIELRTQTEIVALEGDDQAGCESVTFRNRATGAEQTHAVRHVFLFLGAEPTVDWLKGCGVETDKAGFVCTGAALEGSARRQSLETSLTGVFAIGDVRAGSVKRVGAAIGEGAAVVAQIHAYLAVHPAVAVAAA
jgi:thioredoxin reductase (NADPH)